MNDKTKVNDAIIYFYLMGKLSELGFIEGGKYQLTGSGFDIALDLYREGYKIDEETMYLFIKEEKPENKKDTSRIIELLLLEQSKQDS